MITVFMCQSVKVGLTTAATGMSYMGLWTLMVHTCQWAKSLVGLAPGLTPTASALHGLFADSMGFGHQQLVVQPTQLSYSGLSTGDASQITANFGALLSISSCIIGKWR